MRFFIALVFIVFSLSMSAQLNEERIYVDTKAGTWESVYFNSSQLPKVLDFDSLAIDSINFDATAVGSNLFVLNYKTVAGIIGDSEIIVEYYDQGSNVGLANVRFSTLYSLAKTSKVEASNDYIVDVSGSGSFTPTSNDSSSDGPVDLVRIGYAEGCTASIVNDEIQYVLTDNRAEILYFVEDSLGNRNSAKAFIYQEDGSIQLNIDRYTDNKGEVLLHLPSVEFTLASQPQNGDAVYLEQNIWSYRPESSFVGTEELQFSTPAGGLVTYNIEVLNKNLNGSFITDDRVYVPTDGTVTFDVLQNDLKSDLNVVYHSPELTSLSNGVFSYTPPSGFTGDKVFIYKVLSGTVVYTGTITVLVDDYAPINEAAYNFDIVENQVLKVRHNTPITGFDFTVSVEPSNGSLQIIDANGSIVTACDTLTEEHLIVYEPNPGYTGTDEFDIEYCSASGACGEIVKIDVNVVASSNTDCLCLEDCVYRGDHNDDGLVNIKDVLDLGLNIGSGGNTRSNDFNEVWTGQYADDWGFSQLNSTIDLKCGDSDGNGFIDAEDLSDIETYYGNVSEFQATVESVISEVPIYFVPQSTDIDSGEYVHIDIMVGDANFPAIDMQGLAFSFNIDAEVMDSSTVDFVQADNSWLASNSNTFDFEIVPEDGRVDIAISRAGRGSADGIGIVGTLSFIVEDELGGFRESEYVNSLPVTLTNIISTDYYGNYVTHPNYESIVEVIKDSDSSEKKSRSEFLATIFPNPAYQDLNISSNGLIDQVDIMDVTGRLLSSYTTTPHFDQSINIAELTEGIYLVRVQSNDRTITKKVFITQ